MLVMAESSLSATHTGISLALHRNLPNGDSVAMQTAAWTIEVKPEFPAFSFQCYILCDPGQGT